MKSVYMCLRNGFLSIVTTFLLMLAPVAAIVYAAEPAVENDHYIEELFAINRTPEFLLKNDWFTNKVNEWKPDVLDDTLASTLNGLKDHGQGHDKHK